MSDKMLLDINGLHLAVDIAAIVGVVETGKVFFMPGTKEMVEGVITHRGRAIVVVNLRGVFGLNRNREHIHTIVIANDKGRTLGLCIEEKNPSFIWEGTVPDSPCGWVPRPAEEFISTSFEHNGYKVGLIDLGAIYDRTQELLSER